MFEMYETALDTEVQRRREVLAESMRAARGVTPRVGRVADTLRFRHFLAVLVASLG